MLPNISQRQRRAPRPHWEKSMPAMTWEQDFLVEPYSIQIFSFAVVASGALLIATVCWVFETEVFTLPSLSPSQSERHQLQLTKLFVHARVSGQRTSETSGSCLRSLPIPAMAPQQAIILEPVPIQQTPRTLQATRPSNPTSPRTSESGSLPAGSTRAAGERFWYRDPSVRPAVGLKG